MKSRKKKRAPSGMLQPILVVIKAVLCGCVLSVILVLALALVLKWSWMQESGISLLNSIIKAVCALLVGVLCANGCSRREWLWSGVGGGLYILVAFLAFSLVEQSFSLNAGLLADVGMGIAAGVAGRFLLAATSKKHKA